MDMQARSILCKDWAKGLWRRGLEGAHRAAAGLDVDSAAVS